MISTRGSRYLRGKTSTPTGRMTRQPWDKLKRRGGTFISLQDQQASVCRRCWSSHRFIGRGFRCTRKTLLCLSFDFDRLNHWTRAYYFFDSCERLRNNFPRSLSVPPKAHGNAISTRPWHPFWKDGKVALRRVRILFSSGNRFRSSQRCKINEREFHNKRQNHL